MNFSKVSRLFSITLVGVILSSLIFSSIPAHVSAADTKIGPSKEAKIYQATKFLQTCILARGFKGTPSASELDAGNFVNRTSTLGNVSAYLTMGLSIIGENIFNRAANDGEVSVGYLLSSSGTLNCKEDPDIKKAMDAIGMSGLELMTDTNTSKAIYKLDGDLYKLANGDDGVKAAKRIADKVSAKYPGIDFGVNAKASPAAQYFGLLKTYLEACSDGKASGAAQTIKVVSEIDGSVAPTQYKPKPNAGVVSVGAGMNHDGGSDSKMSCDTIVSQLNNTTFVNAAATEVKARVKDGTDTSNGAGATGEGAESPSCEKTGNPLTWVLCPIFNGVADFTDWMFRNMVEPLLRVSPVSTDPSDGSFQVWSSFRIYGNIFLVIAMLVLVFGQAIGGGMIDAYTAKKMAPRLLAAVVMINLSIYIVALLVDITNIVGGGIGALMTAPFSEASQFSFSPNGVQSIAIVGGAAASIAGFLTAVVFSAAAGVSLLGSAAPFIALFVLLPAVVGVMGAFLTLIIRQGLILILILISPIAFALYCLPNTEKYFKSWWNLLFKTLLVYPIVVILFAAADILAITVMNANGAGSGPLLQNPQTGSPAAILASLIAFVCMFLPLVLIPWAFKMAGGVIGSFAATVGKFGKQGTELVKGDARNESSLRNKTKRQLFDGLTRGQNRIVQEGRGVSSSRGAQRRSRFAATFGNVDQRMATANRQERERREMLSSDGDDALIYAGGGWILRAGETAHDSLTGAGGASLAGTRTDSDRYFDAKGRQITQGTYSKGRSLYGASQHQIAGSLQYATQKVQTDQDIANMRLAFAKNAQEQGWSQSEILGNWAKVSYPHKSTFNTEWYSKPELQPNGSIAFNDVANDEGAYGSYIKDLHKTRTNFQLGQLRDNDFRAMGSRMHALQDKMDAGGTLTDEEAAQFAQTDEVLGAMVQQGMVSYADGEVSVSGTTPASQKIIKGIFSDRRYESIQAKNADGSNSVNERTIHKRNAAPPGMPTPPGATRPPSVILGPSVGTAVVTGDEQRSEIPRLVP